MLLEKFTKTLKRLAIQSLENSSLMNLKWIPEIGLL